MATDRVGRTRVKHLSGENILRLRKRKGYHSGNGAVPRCHTCLHFSYDEENPSQRMAAVGVCRHDGTPAGLWMTCKNHQKEPHVQEIEPPAGNGQALQDEVDLDADPSATDEEADG